MRGSKRERSPGVWELRVYLGRDPVTHKRRSISRTFRGGVRAAESRMAELLAEFAGHHTGTETSFGWVIDRRLSFIEPHRSPTTIAEYRRRADRRIKPALGHVPVDQLTAAHLDGFYSDLHDQKVSGSSIHEVHALIRATLNQAVKWGYVPKNVALLASPPPFRRKITSIPEDHSAVLALFASAEKTNPEMAMMLRLAVATVMRRGELCALRWGDIDLERQEIHVSRAIAQVGPKLHEKGTKTHHDRVVPIGPGTVARLEAHREAMEARAAKAEEQLIPNAFVFSDSPSGDSAWRPGRVTLAWNRLRARHGLDGITLHALRHTGISAMIDAGIPVRDVADLAGHLDTSTTLRIYTHGRAGRRREGAAVLDALGSGALPGAGKQAAEHMGKVLGP